MILIRPNSGDTWTYLAWATEDIADLEVSAEKFDGVSTGTTQFDSATATFQTDDVLAGDQLAVSGDAVYTIASVDSETRLQATANISADGAATFIIHRDFDGGRIRRGGLGTVAERVDLSDGGNVATVSDFSFEVLNQDDYINDNDFPDYFAGRVVDVRLLFTDGAGKSWANTLLLHKFTIESIEYDLNVIRFQCIDASIIRHDLQLPQNVLSDSDAAAGESGILPASSKGKGKPLIYGDHVYNFMEDSGATQTGTNLTYDRSSYLTPCVFLGLDQDGDERWLVADHEVNTFDTDQGLWAYDPSLDRMVKVNAYTVEQNTSAGCIVSVDVDAEFLDYWLPDGSVSNEATDGSDDGTATITNSDRSCNRDNSNFTYITVIDSTTGDAPIASFDIDFTGYKNAGTISSVAAWALCYKATTGGNPTITINSSAVDTVTPAKYEAMALLAASEAGGGAVISVELAGEQADPQQTHELWIYMVHKVITYKPASRLQIFAGTIGREFGAWVDADSRNQGYNSGDAIVNVLSIESLLRDEMSLTSSEIDYVAYDAIANTTNGFRKDFETDFSMIDQKNSIEYISEICRHIGAMAFTDYENKETIIAIDKNDAVKSFSKADYELIGGGEGSTSSFRVRKTLLRDVYNDIEVHYFKNWGNNEYQKLMFCNKDAKSSSVSSGYDTKCTTSFTNYGFVRKLVIKSDYISDDATAADIVEWLVDWFYLQKDIPSFTTMINAVDVELGDMVIPYHGRLHKVGNSIVTSIELDLNTDRIRFEMIDHTQDDEMLNGGFETAGGGGADIWANWTEDITQGGVLANEGSIVYEGSDAAKMTCSGAGQNCWAYQDKTVVAEVYRTLRFFTRGDGTLSGRYRIRDVDNAADIQVETNCLDGDGNAITGTTYKSSERVFLVPVGCTTVRIFLASATSAAADAYFDKVQFV